jgi:hypothetical protein
MSHAGARLAAQRIERVRRHRGSRPPARRQIGGVDYRQGCFIGKPLPLDDAIRDPPLYSCFSAPADFCVAAGSQSAASGS